jgi:myo-inositol-1(or 4)-monophosphatase
MPDYLQLAQAVAREAGGIILDSFGIGTPHVLKGDHSPITETDKRVNDLVITRLAAVVPEHSFLGEEGKETNGGEYVWVFDPIDGTVPFLRGIPTNVFALALVKGGEPVLGVVYDPYTARLYHATKGGGAFLNGVRITTSPATDLQHTYIETDHHRGFKNLDFFQRLLEQDVRFLSYSSTVYSHMLVASGQIEGVVFPGTRPWDAAAAKVIIEEAGGITSDIHGNQQRYDGEMNGFVSACTRAYHAKLIEIIASSV